ncbi:MAG: hypothetical protein JO305_02525 [Alphaproteobacteria bacterium]|nr:hypothetical protein [Alphaproteobacteria bacterium]
MNLLIAIAAFADQLDPNVARFLDHFRDGRVPFRLSFGIVAAALALLAILIVWGALAASRIHRLRRLVRSAGTGAEFRRNLPRIDRALSRSMFGAAWNEYRQCLKEGDDGVLYPRRPDEYLGLHAITSASFPARFFAAAHGYFIGIGLLFTFIGLVAALKFAAAGVASSDLAAAKEALNYLLSAAAFKFVTSIAGLGSSLLLSVAARSVTFAIEGAAHGLAGDLERAMAPIFTEILAYDQLAATREQVDQLERIGASLRAVPASGAAVPAGSEPRPSPSPVSDSEALERVLTAFVAELRGSAGMEMRQVATKLSEIGDAIGHMQHHIGNSGEAFADQLSLAASRLLSAAATLQESFDGRADKVGARIDALAHTFAQSEAMFADAASRAARSMGQSVKGAGDEIASGVVQATKTLLATSEALAQRLSGLLGGFDGFNASLGSQVGSMRDIASSLDRTKQALDDSAGIWLRAAAPVIASVEGSRQTTAELSQIADRVGTAQRNMTEMARAVAQVSDKATAVWDNYSTRFEKVDDDLQAVFEQLRGGTRAFGDEVMDFVGKLDASLAKSMDALSLGTEELREVAEILAVGVQAKAA